MPSGARWRQLRLLSSLRTNKLIDGHEKERHNVKTQRTNQATDGYGYDEEHIRKGDRDACDAT